MKQRAAWGLQHYQVQEAPICKNLCTQQLLLLGNHTRLCCAWCCAWLLIPLLLILLSCHAALCCAAVCLW
jgi:hypothetical protein